MIDLSDVTRDSDLSEGFTILRSTGYFGAGGWIPTGASATLGAITPGSGYTAATGVQTTGGTGTGCTVDIAVTAGAITGVTLRAPGTGYTVGDVLTIVQGAHTNGAVVVATIAPLSLSAIGVVTVARETDLAMVPEGDRVQGAMAFYANTPLHLTSESAGAISDVLVWNAQSWRVLSVGSWNAFGFNSAVAVRMTGA